MNELYNKHFILVDAQSRITDGWSDGPRRDRDISEGICINDHGGYQFRLFPDGEENPPMHTMDGIPLYKWDNGKAVLRTEDEIGADRAALPEPDKPVTIEDVMQENKLLKAQIQAQGERSDFIEDCMAEMAMQVYGE